MFYYKELYRPSHATVIGYLINNKHLLTQKSTFDVSKAEFYSGAAEGSDQAWGKAARDLGIKVKDYTPVDYNNLSQEWKDKIEVEYTQARAFLGKPKLTGYNGELTRRDMM